MNLVWGGKGKFIDFLRIISLMYIGISLAATSVSALEFEVHQNNGEDLNAIMASGEILTGDLAILESIIESLPKKKNTAVYLKSPGGSLYEGMRIGLFFRSHGVKAVVEGGADCASACALAFLGGADRAGNSWRSSSTNSRLGFHAFSSDGYIDPDEVQAIVADILTYAEMVDAPLYIIVRALETSSQEMYWLDNYEICALGVKLWSNTEEKFLC